MLEWDMDWIGAVTHQIATASNIDHTMLTIDDTTAERLLDLAGLAAHSSGARTNAPLLCHVLGRAVALGAPLDLLEATVREYAGSAE
jgi:hypothetical protein